MKEWRGGGDFQQGRVVNAPLPSLSTTTTIHVLLISGRHREFIIHCQQYERFITIALNRPPLL